MFQGYARGAVGDVVFSRQGGQQVSRARNRNPNNPKTFSQVVQRARFTNCVRFYQLVTSGFFRLAYEDKKTSESDFAAFMRKNINACPVIPTQLNSIGGALPFPALVSDGSLDNNVFVSEFGTGAAGQATVGVDFKDSTGANYEGGTEGYPDSPLGLSRFLMNKGGYREGDIFTLIVGRWAQSATNIANDFRDGKIPNTLTPPVFNYYQLVVSASAADSWGQPNISFDYNSGDSVELNISPGAPQPAATYTDVLFGAVIKSRIENGGLKVSRSELILKPSNIYEASMSDNFTRAAATEWGYSDDIILKGNLN